MEAIYPYLVWMYILRTVFARGTPPSEKYSIRAEFDAVSHAHSLQSFPSRDSAALSACQASPKAKTVLMHYVVDSPKRSPSPYSVLPYGPAIS